MHERARLLAQGLGQLRMAVTEHQAHHARGQIVILIAVDVSEHDAFAAVEHDAWLITPAEHVIRITRH